MDSFLIAYITQRMNEMGFSDFHFEPVRITSDVNKTTIRSYNEFYYLVSKNVHASLKIISDTNAFNDAAGYSGFNFYQLQEFSGLIEISTTAGVPIDLEFIHVVPHGTNEQTT